MLKESTAGWVASKLQLPKGQRFDPGLTWDQLGVDLLIVDEAQNYKNLYLPAPREFGVPKFMGAAGEGSNRAWQLDFRAMTVRRRSGGAGVVLLSATPAKNSPLEFYNLIQYIAHDAFARQGIEDPEQFIDRYCRLETKIVVDMVGNAKTASACVGFMNLHELRDTIFWYGEFETAEDVEKAGAPVRHAAWLELTDKQGRSVDGIARVWGWASVDVEKGIQAARGLVPEETPDSEGNALQPPEDETPRLKAAARNVALAQHRLGDGRTWLDLLGNVCDRMGYPLAIGLDEGLKLPKPISRQIQVVGDDEQERKRLDYAKRIEAMLANPKLGNPLGLLALLGLVGIHANLDDRKQVGVDKDTGAPVFEALWNWENAESVRSPSSPKFRAVRDLILERPDCGHIVFVESIAAHVWLRMVLEEAGIDRSRIAILNADPHNPEHSADARQRIAADFNGTPELTFLDPATGMPTTFPAVEPKYDVVIANQVAYEGINLQRRTCRVYHVDLPWDPATLQQRNGRAWRQGNQFSRVEIYYFMMKCFPDSMKFTLIQGKRAWMADLIEGQARETNNPGAQMNMGPEEILAMIACDPVKARLLFAAVEAKRKAEQDAKTAANASATLRTAGFFFSMARAADRPGIEAQGTRQQQEKKTEEQALYRVRPGDSKVSIARKLGAYHRDNWEEELDRVNPRKRKKKHEPAWKPLKVGELLNLPAEWAEAQPEAGTPQFDRCGNAPREAEQQLGRANRLRAEGELRLADVSRVDPKVWPWGEWAQAARDHTMLVFVPTSKTENRETPSGTSELVKVYEKAVAPLYEGLRTKSPDDRDHRVLNFDEYGRVRDGYTIGARSVGQVEWRVVRLAQIGELHLLPEHRITDASDWPADDEVRMDGVMRGEILPKLARHLSTTTEKVLRELNWVDATDEWVTKMWARYGADITSHLNDLQDRFTLDADKLEVPGVRGGVLTVGVKQRLDAILPPTRAGYEEFLALAPISDASYGALLACARYWWALGLPSDLLSGATAEQKAARAALLKAKKKKDAGEVEVGGAEAGEAETDGAEAGEAEAGGAEAGEAETGGAETGEAETGREEAGETDADETGPSAAARRSAPAAPVAARVGGGPEPAASAAVRAGAGTRLEGLSTVQRAAVARFLPGAMEGNTLVVPDVEAAIKQLEAAVTSPGAVSTDLFRDALHEVITRLRNPHHEVISAAPTAPTAPERGEAGGARRTALSAAEERRANRLAQAALQGVQVNLLDTPRIAAVAKTAVAQGKSDADVRAALDAFIATIRVDRSTAPAAGVQPSVIVRRPATPPVNVGGTPPAPRLEEPDENSLPRRAEEPTDEFRKHVQRRGEKLYGDTQFLRILRDMPGNTVKELELGAFSVVTPQGDIEFDRMRGVEFPGQSGVSHWIYGKGLAATMEALGMGDLVPRPAPAPARAGAEHVRVVSDMVFADDVFKDAARALPGNSMQMVLGRYELQTPDGRVIFDPEGSAKRVGMTYTVRGQAHVVNALLDAMGLGDLAPGRAGSAAAGRATSTPVERPFAEYKSLGYNKWGIAVEGPAPTPGERIKVKTKGGKVKTEVVATIVREGVNSQGEPATICTVVPK